MIGLNADEDTVTSKVTQLFASIDFNGDGQISEEEFIKKCQEGNVLEDRRDPKNDKNNRRNSEGRNSEKPKEEIINFDIDESELDYLCKLTRFERSEIIEWFRFHKILILLHFLKNVIFQRFHV